MLAAPFAGGAIKSVVKGLTGAALLATASAACALGLGQGPSALLLGEFLDYGFPVRLEPGEELAESCVSADVYFGDNKLPASLVHARVESRSETLKVVRVLTDRRIDEPVVMIYVVAGCKEAHVSRKFVAFADPPGLSLPAVAQAPGAVFPTGPALRVAAGPLSAPTSVPVAASSAARLSRDEPAPSSPVAPVPPSAPADAARVASPSGSTGKGPADASTVARPDAKAGTNAGAGAAAARQATGKAAMRGASRAARRQ